MKDDAILYHGIRLPSKIDQRYRNPNTRTQATIVCYPEGTCTTFKVAKIHAK